MSHKKISKRPSWIIWRVFFDHFFNELKFTLPKRKMGN